MGFMKFLKRTILLQKDTAPSMAPDLYKRAAPGEIVETVGGLKPENMTELSSSAPNHYSIFIKNDFLPFIQKYSFIDNDIITATAATIYMGCRDRDFLNKRPVHFILNLKETTLKDATMCISKITPPMFYNFKAIDRSILVIKDDLGKSVKKLEDRIILVCQAVKHNPNEEELAAIRSNTFVAKQMNTLFGLAHEMVHLFVTDEFSGEWNHLGLDKPELLTDSLVFLIYYDLIKTQRLVIQVGVVEALAYLSNELAGKGINPYDDLTSMYTLATKIAADCKKVRRESKNGGLHGPTSKAIKNESPVS